MAERRIQGAGRRGVVGATGQTDTWAVVPLAMLTTLVAPAATGEAAHDHDVMTPGGVNVDTAAFHHDMNWHILEHASSITLEKETWEELFELSRTSHDSVEVEIVSTDNESRPWRSSIVVDPKFIDVEKLKQKLDEQRFDIVDLRPKNEKGYLIMKKRSV